MLVTYHHRFTTVYGLELPVGKTADIQRLIERMKERKQTLYTVTKITRYK
jgi:hypothetical protein